MQNAKTKQNGQRNVHNLIILDESGSMESIKSATISGFNELVQTIRGVEKRFPDQCQFVSLYTFNSEGIKKRLFAEPLESLGELDETMFEPDAMTPLYDAVGHSVNELRRHIETEKNSHALVTIFTDGEENNSMEYDQRAVKSLIERLTDRGWIFTYIGSSQNVEKDAADIGVSAALKSVASLVGFKEAFDKDGEARMKYAERLDDGDESSGDYFND